jgi:hypothetical protein
MNDLVQILGILGGAVTFVVGITTLVKGLLVHGKRRMAEGRSQWICTWMKSEEGVLHLDSAFDGIIERRRIRKQLYRKDEGNGST